MRTLGPGTIEVSDLAGGRRTVKGTTTNMPIYPAFVADVDRVRRAESRRRSSRHGERHGRRRAGLSHRPGEIAARPVADRDARFRRKRYGVCARGGAAARIGQRSSCGSASALAGHGRVLLCVLFLAGAGLWTFGVIRGRGEPSLSSSWIGWFAGPRPLPPPSSGASSCSCSDGLRNAVTFPASPRGARFMPPLRRLWTSSPGRRRNR